MRNPEPDKNVLRIVVAIIVTILSGFILFLVHTGFIPFIVVSIVLTIVILEIYRICIKAPEYTEVDVLAVLNTIEWKTCSQVCHELAQANGIKTGMGVSMLSKPNFGAIDVILEKLKEKDWVESKDIEEGIPAYRLTTGGLRQQEHNVDRRPQRSRVIGGVQTPT